MFSKFALLLVLVTNTNALLTCPAGQYVFNQGTTW